MFSKLPFTFVSFLLCMYVST
ncbi:hypothetical protein Gotur_001264, partial [Gossypium turneri]